MAELFRWRDADGINRIAVEGGVEHVQVSAWHGPTGTTVRLDRRTVEGLAGALDAHLRATQAHAVVEEALRSFLYDDELTSVSSVSRCVVDALVEAGYPMDAGFRTEAVPPST